MGTGASTQHTATRPSLTHEVAANPYPVAAAPTAQSPQSPQSPGQSNDEPLHLGQNTRSASVVAHQEFTDPVQWVAKKLPGCVEIKEFANLTAKLLAVHGMFPRNTVACISLCRDEICAPAMEVLQAKWGISFNMSGLAGMLTLGKTGMGAAMHHAPVEGGRERYFFMGFAHIAVDVSGIGDCLRAGRPSKSSACGALCAVRSELKSGRVSYVLDPMDLEFSLVKQKVTEHLTYGKIPDLLEITKTTAAIILEQLEALCAATVHTEKADYAVCVGVQVHQGAGGVPTGKESSAYSSVYTDLMWPTSFYIVKEGRKIDLLPQLHDH
eukprot:RCo047464